MKILFISHSYPPILGGVESQNYNLAQELSKITPTKIIANGKGKIWLPIFIPLTFIRALFLMINYDACLVGSGVLAPVAAALKFFHPKKKFFSVIHALDVTFSFKKGFLPFVYKIINIPSIKAMDKLLVVGNFGIEALEKAGVPKHQSVFIPNGVPVENIRKNYTKKDLESLLKKDLQNKKVIFRLGRFVPHKGTAWFIENIMPQLDQDIILVAAGGRVAKNTAGDPDNFIECEKAIRNNHLENRVILIPNIPQNDLEILLNTADLVVAPNIDIPGSSEGFGINAIEAAACERVVVASNFQGLADAIKDDKNGFLVEPGNIEQWVKKIKTIFSTEEEFRKEFGKKASQFVIENYSWKKIAKRYLEEIEKLVRTTD